MEFMVSRLKITLTLVLSLTIFFGGNLQTKAQTQIKDPLTLEMILTGLKSKSSELSLANKNEFIKLRVNELGVDFPWTAKVEKDLRAGGASDSLIEAIRRKAPKIVDEKQRAEAKLRREKRDKEIADLSKVIESNPKDADTYRKRAALYDNYADYRLALEDYVRVLEIVPDDDQAKYRLNRILDDFSRYFYIPVRRSDSPFERDAYVKGYISIGKEKRRESMLNPPFYKGDGDKSFGDRKELVYVLAFVNEKGRVVSATEISNQFWLTRSAVQAAKSSGFLEKRAASEKSENDWVIIIYEYAR
jgi:tetratricopeptide (TPR) repeat protein